MSIDLHAGACFATATEEVRRQIFAHNKHLDDALLISHAKFLLAWGDIEPPEWKKGKGKDFVWRAVEQYFGNFSPLTDHVQPYMTTEGKPTVEFRFALPLEPLSATIDGGGFPAHPSDATLPFTYGGKFDLLGRLAGRVVALDEKTTKGIGQSWADQWNLRSQFIGYVWALQQLGFDCDTAVIRGIALLINETKFAESIRPYSNFVIARWHEQLRRDLWRMVRLWHDDYFDFNLGETCTAYGNCQFLNVCASPTPENWLTEFEIRHWSPLSHAPDPVPQQPTLVR